jgi:hypothetical protein
MAGIVSAQNFDLKFTVKTPIMVGEGTLPAGSYQIRTIDENTFECANASTGSPSVLFTADAMETTPTKSELGFAKYNDKLVLKSFAIAGDQGYFIPMSNNEKRIKKATGVKSTKVTTPVTK